MRLKNSFWSYQAEAPLDYAALSKDCFNGTREQWEQLSPGFRREIVRQFEKRIKNELIRNNA